MIEIIDGIVSGIATSGGSGGQTINNEDMTITSNGIYTASEGYTGIGTATVNVPAGSDQKYGATINNFLGDVDANGLLLIPSSADFVFTGVKDINKSYISHRYSYMGNIRSVVFPDLESITRNNALEQGFGIEQVVPNDALETIIFSKLKTVSGRYGMMTCFGGREHFNNFDSSVFPVLEELTGSDAMNKCFTKCTSLTSAIFPSLKIMTGDSALRYCFNDCTSLTSISFPALKSDSFGSYTNQFSGMLNSCSNVTVHFPSNLQSVIGSWSDVQNGFGGTNTVVLFDLPATE